MLSRTSESRFNIALVRKYLSTLYQWVCYITSGFYIQLIHFSFLTFKFLLKSYFALLAAFAFVTLSLGSFVVYTYGEMIVDVT